MPTEPLSTLVEDEEGDLPSQVTPEPKPEPAAPEPGAVVKPKVDLEAALAELTGTVKTLATPKPTPPKELTPEEMNAKWAVFEPEKADKQFFHKLFNLPADTDPKVLEGIKTAWSLMQNGLMRQALQGSLNLVEHHFGEKFAKIDELEAWRNQASAKELRNDFHRTYPALADPKYDKIVKLVDSELTEREFDSHSAYFKALAEGAAEYIKTIDQGFDLGAAPKPTAGNTPKLTRTRVGGTGGAGGGTPTKAQDSDQSHTLEP